MKVLTRKEIRDLVQGCAILGTGGGGDPQRGLALLEATLREGRECKLVRLDEVPDEAWVASPYMCGSVSPEEARHSPAEPECLLAFEALEDFLGTQFFAAVATEIGGGNTALALYTAAKHGLPLVDGDPAGRSVPELQHSTFYVHSVPIAPLALASARGEVLIIKRVADDFRAEAIVRAVAVACGNRVGVTDHPTTGKVLKETLIPGTVSKALAIGQAIRKAREAKEDPVEALVQAGNGYKLFQGRVVEHNWRVEAGFTFGELTISGEQEYQGHLYKIWYKNEHLISWFDGEADVIAPDLICVVHPETAEAITNPNCRVGMSVAVVGFPAPPAWRQGRGLEVLGPKHFGFDLAYRKLEENRRLA